MGLGLLLGATVVGFRTSLADLAVMGALTGVVLGVAQTVALPARTRRRWWWAAAMPLLWALGWTVTTLAGIPVEEQFTIFGASGAVTFSALSGLLLYRLLPVAPDHLDQHTSRRGPGGEHAMSRTARHVIFGTGAIGLATLDALLRRGETVRMVNRSGSAPVPDEVEVVGGDAADPRFTADVTRGAQVVYQTLNPPYPRWVEDFPALQAGVLAAAQAHGARLVSMENVYMYGRPAGRPLAETRDYAAHTKKGKLRARMATELLAAHQAGRWRSPSDAPRTTSARAAARSPTSATGCSPPPWPGRPPASSATPTSPTPTPTSPTSARASPFSASTPTRPDRCGTCPTTPTPAPPASCANSPSSRPAAARARIRQVPPLLLRLAALTNRTVRELLEMQYQFAEPFIVDSSKIANALGVHATPVEQALADTLATYHHQGQRSTV